jgi:hypothetical protein
MPRAAIAFGRHAPGNQSFGRCFGGKAIATIKNPAGLTGGVFS